MNKTLRSAFLLSLLIVSIPGSFLFIKYRWDFLPQLSISAMLIIFFNILASKYKDRLNINKAAKNAIIVFPILFLISLLVNKFLINMHPVIHFVIYTLICLILSFLIIFVNLPNKKEIE
jgi:hypothetical protein